LEPTAGHRHAVRGGVGENIASGHTSSDQVMALVTGGRSLLLVGFEAVVFGQELNEVQSDLLEIGGFDNAHFRSPVANLKRSLRKDFDDFLF